MSGFGSCAVGAYIFHHFTADNDFVASLDLGVAVGPLLVAEVEAAIYIELTCGCAIVADVECGVAKLGAEFFFHRSNFAFDIHIVGRFGIVGESVDIGSYACCIVGVVDSTVARCCAATCLTAAGAATVAVERVDIGFVCDSFGGVALVVNHLTADYHFVAHLDLSVAACPFLVAEVEAAEHIELVVGCTVVADVERSVAK